MKNMKNREIVIGMMTYVITDPHAFLLALLAQTAFNLYMPTMSAELKLLAAQVEEKSTPFEEAYAMAVAKFGAATMLELANLTRYKNRPFWALATAAGGWRGVHSNAVKKQQGEARC